MIAILEANIKTICAMRRALQSADLERQMVYFETAPNMLQWLDENIAEVRLMSLGSDLGTPWYRNGKLIQAGAGMDVVKGLRRYQPNCSVIIHSDNKRNNAEMGVELAYQGINCSGMHCMDENWIENEWLPRVISELKLTSHPFVPKTVN